MPRLFCLWVGMAALPSFLNASLPNSNSSLLSLGRSGGGAAEDLGASGISVNAATLQLQNGWEAETGFMNLSELETPFLAFGNGTPHSSQALEYAARPWNNHFLQTVLAGTSMPLWKAYWGQDFRVGATLRAESEGDQLGVDADLGIFHRHGAWRFGLAVQRILESGAGSDSGFDQSTRASQTGIAWEPSAGFDDFRPRASYDFQLPEFAWSQSHHLASVGATVLPGGPLHLDVSARVPQRHPEDLGWALGLQTRFQAFHTALECRYALTYRAQDSRASGPQHAIALQMHWQGMRDAIPPRVEASVEPSVWISDSVGPPLSFRLGVDDNRHQPKDWKLSLHRLRADGTPGEGVREFSGEGLPPRVVQWRGLGPENLPLPAGLYAYQLWAEDVDGNSAVTPWRWVEIRNPATPAAP